MAELSSGGGMKKVVIAVIMLVSGNVWADADVPVGCYMPLQTPGVCWPPSDVIASWTYFGNEDDNLNYYGPICGAFAYDAAVRGANWTFWQTKSEKQSKQIKRLKAQINALKE